MIDPLTEDQQVLAIEAVNRAERIAARYARIFPEHAQEFHSSALWGVVRAASSFDPDKGGIWEKWSHLAIKGEIRDFLGCAYVRTHEELSANRAILIPDGGGKVETVGESDERIKELLDTLPNRHRELCKLVYMKGICAADAGREMGMSPKQGCLIHREAMEFLRHELAA